jgi:hypothetical protein
MSVGILFAIMTRLISAEAKSSANAIASSVPRINELPQSRERSFGEKNEAHDVR